MADHAGAPQELIQEAKGAGRHRRFLFTLFTQAKLDDHKAWAQAVYDEGKRVQFLVYQVESCPNTGRRHLQGYLEVHSPCGIGHYGDPNHRDGGIKAILQDGGVHIDVARGSAEQCIAYCTKEESRVEEGLRLGQPGPGQGHRSDIADLHRDVVEGKAPRDIARAHPCYIKYHRGVHATLGDLRRGTWRRELRIHVLTGESGIGKTAVSYARWPNLFRAPDNRCQWFDGYNGEQSVLFDEYCGDAPMGLFLKIADIYPLDLPIKGGFVPLAATILIFTSNTKWEDWYPNDTPSYPAFVRRINERAKVWTEQEIRQAFQELQLL